MTPTTYASLQAGNVLVERGADGNVTLTDSRTNLGVTYSAADFDAIVAGYPSLKTGQPAGR